MKKMIFTLLILALALVGSGAMAEDVNKENAMAAAKVSLPEAQFDYAVRERDDGRFVWELFFSQGSQLGVCKVLEENNEVRRVELFGRPDGALNASEAMALLAEKKGAIVVTDLELDYDDGRLSYEGDAELNGKRYEFKMNVNGSIVEWERD